MSGEPGPETGALGDEERDAILRLFDSVMAQTAAPDRRPLGCVAAFLAIVVLLLLPWLEHRLNLGLPRPLVLIVAGLLVLVVLIGAGVSAFGGARGAAIARAEDALAQLASRFPTAAADEKRRWAVTLLIDAYESSGPTTVPTFDFDDGARRLGAALPYVVQVERLLRSHRDIYRVFTLRE